MNVRFTALSIILLASATASAAPGFARDGTGNRFQFAPNVYAQEAPNVPNQSYTATPPARSAMDGRVPHGPSILGLDPQFLARPVAPPVRPQAFAPSSRTNGSMRPGFNRPGFNQPGMTPASPDSAAFKPSFGQPASPPVMATLPKSAAPLSLPSGSFGKGVSGKLTHPPAALSDKHLSGKLVNHRRPLGRSADPALALAKNIDSYGKNVGYTPGPFLPVSSGSGMNAKATVSGTLINKHRH